MINITDWIILKCDIDDIRRLQTVQIESEAQKLNTLNFLLILKE